MTTRPTYGSETGYGNTGSCTPSWPTGISAGDLILGFATTGGTSAGTEGAGIGVPSGWTIIDNSGPGCLAIYTATGSESGTMTWTHGTITGVMVVQIQRIPGGNASGVTVTRADSGTSNVTSLTAASQSVPSDSCLLVAMINLHTTSNVTVTGPSGSTVNFQGSTTSGGPSPRRIAGGSTPEDASTSSTTGTQAWSFGSSEARLACVLVPPVGSITGTADAGSDATANATTTYSATGTAEAASEATAAATQAQAVTGTAEGVSDASGDATVGQVTAATGTAEAGSDATGTATQASSVAGTAEANSDAAVDATQAQSVTGTAEGGSDATADGDNDGGGGGGGPTLVLADGTTLTIVGFADGTSLTVVGLADGTPLA